jgi:hypothetical protein
MPALQPLVLKDRAATPVDHTFAPRDIVNRVGTVVESTGTPIGDRSVSISVVKSASGRYNATVKGTFPVVQTQTVNGISTPVVVRISRAELKFSYDGTSTEQERKDVVGMMQSCLDPSKTLVNDGLIKLEGIY